MLRLARLLFYPRRHYLGLAMLGLLLSWSLASTIALGQNLQLLSNGWLEVRQTSGRVIVTASPPRAARVGDRLQKIGDSLQTGPNSSSVLRLDDGIGTINVAENTALRIRQMARLRSGARVTTLALDNGQVRLNIRPFTHRESRLDIISPAGVAAVRGTEYGVTVNDDGRMIVATESGLVTAAAQGKTVFLEPNFGSRLRPQQPPSDPMPLDRELRLQIEQTEINDRQIYVRGQIDPLNSVTIAGASVPIDNNGRFEANVPLPDSSLLFDYEIAVSNALGERRSYSLVSWQ